MRVLVCGGRDYDQRGALNRKLDELHAERPVQLLVSGGAAGADRLGQLWAERHKIPVAVYPANWRFVGRAAGPVRNGSMLTFGQPDLVVAFSGGAGTSDMVRRARQADIEVVEIAE